MTPRGWERVDDGGCGCGGRCLTRSRHAGVRATAGWGESVRFQNKSSLWCSLYSPTSLNDGSTGCCRLLSSGRRGYMAWTAMLRVVVAVDMGGRFGGCGGKMVGVDAGVERKERGEEEREEKGEGEEEEEAVSFLYWWMLEVVLL